MPNHDFDYNAADFFASSAHISEHWPNSSTDSTYFAVSVEQLSPAAGKCSESEHACLSILGIVRTVTSTRQLEEMGAGNEIPIEQERLPRRK